ncbi:hypothetical protein [Oceanobacillus senegalensis]|uniref:hypothetical protein n=1 Tax=Oceanobacillus senegalensis TaxID=1936063 RepID=UPI000A305B6D|nr:hypothetical protein [Oceanobacillus senegalensis]
MKDNHCESCKSSPCSCPIYKKNKIVNNPSYTNTFNPTIHVHPVVSSSNENIGEPASVASAFRANKSDNQRYSTPEDDVVVSFGVDRFDLENEYNNPVFTPNQEGVYSISTEVGFVPDTNNYDAVLTIEVNNEIVASDFLRNVSDIQTLSISTIEGLNAGDNVSVFFEASVTGYITPIFNIAFFAAARFPFEGSVPPISPTSSSTLLSDHESKLRKMKKKR